MSKYTVVMQTSLELLVEGETPDIAAHAARDRILGLLREMPAAFMSVGFRPEHQWMVRPANEPDHLRGRPQDAVLFGVDADLRDEYDRRALSAAGAAPTAPDARLREALESCHRYALNVVGAAEAYGEADCAHMWNEIAAIAEEALWPRVARLGRDQGGASG